MADQSTIVCVLCNASERERQMLAGCNGHICFPCIGKAFAAVARTYGAERGPEATGTGVDESGKCLLCDRPITATMLVAHRDPYFFCAECLDLAFAIALQEGPANFALVPF